MKNIPTLFLYTGFFILVGAGCTSMNSEVMDRVLIPRQDVASFASQLPDPCAFDEIDALHFFSQEKSPYGPAVNEETDWVEYKNPAIGLELSIPYNPIWGSPDFRLNPYDATEDKIRFGTINVRGEGCGAWVGGTQDMDVLPWESKEDTLKRLQKESDASEVGYHIEERTIYGKEVIEYIKDGMCGGGGTIVIGKKYNYEFSTVCSANTREDIIQTMKFIDH